MKRLQTRSRIPLCGCILLSFFLPAYKHYSAFQFIGIVRNSIDKAYDITNTDAVIAISLLLLIPFSTAVLLLRTWLCIPTRRVYVAMPLIFFMFFSGLFFATQTSLAGPSSVNLFTPAEFGFYLAAACSVMLLFTKNQKRKRRKKTEIEREAELAS